MINLIKKTPHAWSKPSPAGQVHLNCKAERGFPLPLYTEAPSPVPKILSQTKRTRLQNPSPQEHVCAQQETEGSVFHSWQVASGNMGWISFFENLETI